MTRSHCHQSLLTFSVLEHIVVLLVDDQTLETPPAMGQLERITRHS